MIGSGTSTGDSNKQNIGTGLGTEPKREVLVRSNETISGTDVPVKRLKLIQIQSDNTSISTGTSSGLKKQNLL
jgi:hypothetical protein